ncbi:unnamed protein product, partial [Sphenostylis stenocarpa]
VSSERETSNLDGAYLYSYYLQHKHMFDLINNLWQTHGPHSVGSINEGPNAMRALMGCGTPGIDSLD